MIGSSVSNLFRLFFQTSGLKQSRHCDRISCIYRYSKSDVPKDGAKVAVRLKADSSWDVYAKQGFLIHDLPAIRSSMAEQVQISIP